MNERRWYEVRDEAGKVRVDIYGDIGSSYWDDDAVSAKDLIDQLAAADGRDVELHVNSGGGSVFDACAMMTALKNHNGRVTAYVDGLAASAASYLIMAADEIVMSSVSWMMIHNASTISWGNSRDLREAADYLDSVDRTICGIYTARGRDDVDFQELMDATTWMDATDALDYGLVDRIDEVMAVAAHVDTRDSATLDSAPEAVRDLLKIKVEVEVGEPGEPAPAEPEPDEPAQTDGASDEHPIMASSAPAVEDHGTEPEQEPRCVVIDGQIYTINGRGNNA